MNRYFVPLVCLLVSIGTIPALAATKQQKGGLFAAEIPDGWRWNENEAPGYVVIRDDKGNQQALIQFGQATGPGTEDEVRKRIQGMTDDLQSRQGAVDLKESDATIGGVYARQLDFVVPSMGNKKLTYLAFADQGYAYGINYGFGADAADRGQVEEITKSFRFTSQRVILDMGPERPRESAESAQKRTEVAADVAATQLIQQVEETSAHSSESALGNPLLPEQEDASALHALAAHASEGQDFLPSSYYFEKLLEQAIESPGSKPEETTELRDRLLMEYSHLGTQRHLSKELSLRVLQCADQLLSESNIRVPEFYWRTVLAWQAVMYYDLSLAGVQPDVLLGAEDRWDSPFTVSDDGTPEGIKNLAARSVAAKLAYTWPYSGGKAGQDKLGGCSEIAECRQKMEQSIAQGDASAHLQLIRIYFAFPDDWVSAGSLGMSYFTDKRYPEAVRYLDSAVTRMIAAQAADDQIAGMRTHLLRAYDELGRQNVFSEELCLRMLHHMKAVIEYVEKDGTSGMVKEINDWADKTINYLLLARVGTQVHVFDPADGSIAGALPELLDKKPKQLVLPMDGIPRSDKEASAEYFIKRLGRVS